ncbi:hypothetical protein JHU04_001109 [Brenneria sp. 4F2]|nr:hypothetical protein [Brenneria bubanii]
MVMDRYKRELIYRRGNGKRFLTRYKEKIFSLFQCDPEEVTFLSLEETDAIIFKKPKERLKLSEESFSATDCGKMLDRLRECSSEYYVFIDDDWRYCGAFSIITMRLLKNDFIFGELIENNIFFISKDLRKLIDLDYFEFCGFFYIEMNVFSLS